MNLNYGSPEGHSGVGDKYVGRDPAGIGVEIPLARAYWLGLTTPIMLIKNWPKEMMICILLSWIYLIL